MMKAIHRKRENARAPYPRYRFASEPHKRMPPLAVVKRSRYEANEFEIWISPDMKIMLGQGFESEQAAQSVADDYNRKDKRK